MPECPILNAAALQVSGLAKSYGDTPVLRDIDLAVAPGAVVALLGPSGCGKTTLLRLVAGFDRADSGSVTLGGRPVADGPAGGRGCWVPPFRRGIGYVPQDGVLFPHLDVAANVGFGLSPAGRRSGRVEAMLDLVGMAGFGRRMPHELSGGQQQRVSIARALAPSPAVVLLDEPFNALDAHLRRTLCAEVRAILKRGGAAALMVTHDRDEAFTVADEIAVMRAGRIVQRGTPADFYRAPVDLDTARLAGAAMLLDGTLTGASAETALGRLPVRNPHGVPDGPVALMLRPEQVVAAAPGAGLRVTVRHAAMLGPLTWLDLETEGGAVALQACWVAAAPPEAGSAVLIEVRGDAMVFPPE
ncbi:ABC transporter ATP-binding protein [Lichenibacterium ramalinae]|uniref:ABC transporter ATP-binding protein n=1 Tax=Lichenibacterium ramalinae TaxID=2316527 RepID=UPI001A939353|nr:ABC transporter ATP-binding protein [Lichenibacterium ramalinae]